MEYNSFNTIEYKGLRNNYKVYLNYNRISSIINIDSIM